MFSDLGKGQTGASLEIDVIGVDQGAQGAQRLSGKEVGLGALVVEAKRSENEVQVGLTRTCKAGRQAYILQVTQKIGDGFSFIVGQGSLVDSLSRTISDGTEPGSDMTPAINGGQA